jgi:hypothetical protein
MELQHVNVKLLVKNPERLDLASVVPVFHSWIQDQLLDGQLLDVADYRHVVAGPGVILIAHEGDYSIDNTDRRIGVRYNRKIPLSATNQERLAQATRAALTACQLLADDPTTRGQIEFNGQDVEIFSNDRLLAPNHVETRTALEPEFRTFAKKLFGGKPYYLSFSQDPRRLLTAFLTASQPISLATLASNLAS